MQGDLALLSQKWIALPQAFCPCGWLASQNDRGQVYCENRACKNFGKLFDVSVTVSETQIFQA